MFDSASDAHANIDWAKSGGIVPAIIQDASTGRVLMLGYMDRDALQATTESRRVTFFSRSRQRAWTKGETSGHFLELVSIAADCDGDALLVLARPQGPTCHRGTTSCFSGAIAELDVVIASRCESSSEESYTRRLLDAGIKRIAQKVGEEGVETALAGIGEDDATLLGEAADLVYHTLVLLRAHGLGLADLEAVLRTRAADRCGDTAKATTGTPPLS
ncbi:MAG TPA: bifunctional phosphoribosyl-AMP cyclohydrolase/phosphoribosyl-ATP diphosphatase HisIE [Rhodanobacteraceae bacterium]|nr:bifunctional phosphoribosyl-AMP cyclohydrolase/phosphoribosyl-ATP diphosphatase HisIE [Rhodanobacteraceae bacterium]